MLTIRSPDFSEKQLAEVALAIQNRWEVPTFVKMHEVMIVDDDLDDSARKELSTYFEKGMFTILENLGLAWAFKVSRVSSNKFALTRIPGSILPKWMSEIEQAPVVPEGVYACPHCGKQFPTEMQMSLHTKLHYLA